MNSNLLTVIDLARLTEVESHVIRYYTKIGLLNPDRDSSNGYKFYNKDDALRVRFTRKAKSLGYSLNEIKTIFEHAKQGESPCALVREIITKRLKETQEKISELESLQERMKKAIKEWDVVPNKDPDGETICHLIEGFVDG